MTAPQDNGEAPLESRALTAEEQFYHETSFKEPVESVKRLEEAAKFLAGAVATTSGLFVAALKAALGSDGKVDGMGILPFVLWCASLLMLVQVFVPQRYATGRNEPISWKAAFVEAMKHKYLWLRLGAVFFALGIFAGALPLIRW